MPEPSSYPDPAICPMEVIAMRRLWRAVLAETVRTSLGMSTNLGSQPRVEIAKARNLLLAGPNGQGVVSTPAGLCAQIVAPYPPRGGIAIASQSGNFVSSFENYARASGVGVSRAVSAGNAAALTVADYLEYYAADPETKVSLAYLEGIVDGRELYERLIEVAAQKPLVVLKGGATAGGQYPRSRSKTFRSGSPGR